MGSAITKGFEEKIELLIAFPLLVTCKKHKLCEYRMPYFYTVKVI